MCTSDWRGSLAVLVLGAIILGFVAARPLYVHGQDSARVQAKQSANHNPGPLPDKQLPPHKAVQRSSDNKTPNTSVPAEPSQPTTKDNQESPPPKQSSPRDTSDQSSRGETTQRPEPPKVSESSVPRARWVGILSSAALLVALTTMALFLLWGHRRSQETRIELGILREQITRQERVISGDREAYRAEIGRIHALIRDQALIIGDWHLAKTRYKESPESVGRSEALKRVYAQFRDRLQQITSSISPLESHVTAVQQAAFARDGLLMMVQGFTEEFHRMINLDGELARSEARLLKQLTPEETEERSLRDAMLRGQIDPSHYLQRILAREEPSDRVDLSDPEAEQARLGLEVDQFPARFLTWLDQAAEIREEAGRTHAPLADACTQLIAAARPIAQEHWQIEIEDVVIGRTRFDGRLHELVISKPSSGILPETIIAVHRLGHRREGKVIRKPQVVVAAAV